MNEKNDCFAALQKAVRQTQRDENRPIQFLKAITQARQKHVIETRRLEISKFNASLTPICIRCKWSGPLCAFHFSFQKQPCDPHCINCVREKLRDIRAVTPLCMSYAAVQRREKVTPRRAFVAREKLRLGKCVDCNLPVTETTHNVFDFDHLPGSKKICTVSEMINILSYTFDDLEKEMCKCHLRCARCHKKVMEKRKQENASIKKRKDETSDDKNTLDHKRFEPDSKSGGFCTDVVSTFFSNSIFSGITIHKITQHTIPDPPVTKKIKAKKFKS
jgi:hypothetical protein